MEKKHANKEFGRSSKASLYILLIPVFLNFSRKFSSTDRCPSSVVLSWHSSQEAYLSNLLVLLLYLSQISFLLSVLIKVPAFPQAFMFESCYIEEYWIFSFLNQTNSFKFISFTAFTKPPTSFVLHRTLLLICPHLSARDVLQHSRHRPNINLTTISSLLCLCYVWNAYTAHCSLKTQFIEKTLHFWITSWFNTEQISSNALISWILFLHRLFSLTLSVSDISFLNIAFFTE